MAGKSSSSKLYSPSRNRRSSSSPSWNANGQTSFEIQLELRCEFASKLNIEIELEFKFERESKLAPKNGIQTISKVGLQIPPDRHCNEFLRSRYSVLRKSQDARKSDEQARFFLVTL